MWSTRHQSVTSTTRRPSGGAHAAQHADRRRPPSTPSASATAAGAASTPALASSVPGSSPVDRDHRRDAEVAPEVVRQRRPVRDVGARAVPAADVALLLEQRDRRPHRGARDRLLPRQLRLGRDPLARPPLAGADPRAQLLGEAVAQRPAHRRHGATTTFSASPARIRGNASGVSSRPMTSETTERMPPASAAEHVERRHLVAVARRVGAVDLDLLVVEDVGGELDVRRALRQAAEEQHAPARGGHLHRLLLGGVARAGDDHDVGAEAVGRARDRGLAVLLLGVDVGDAVVADDRVRQLEPPRRALEQQHLPGALQPGERHVRGADRPGADHDHDVVEADGDVLVAADDVRERVGERRVRGRQPVGDAEQVLERDVRDDHALGVGAGVVEAHQLAVQAEVLRAAAAHPAAPAPQRRDAVDGVADRDAARRDLLLGARADLDDLAGDLVAEHPGRLDAAVAVVERAHVGAADAAREHVQEHAVLGADRVRRGADIHRPRPVPDRCAHCLLLRWLDRC